MLHSKRESTQNASVSQGFTGAQNQIKRRENQKARARTVPPVSPNTRRRGGRYYKEMFLGKKERVRCRKGAEGKPFYSYLCYKLQVGISQQWINQMT